MDGKNKKEHAKMPPSQRAKQFLPFDAVAGLRQALKMKEHEMGLITRKELSEEMAEDINGTLTALTPGDHISVMYFREEASGEEGEMTLITGRLLRIDAAGRVISVREDGDPEDIHGFSSDTVIKIDDIASIDLFAEGL